MPYETITLNLPDSQLRDNCYWVRTEGGASFTSLTHSGISGELVSTTKQVHGILSSIVEMLDRTEHHIFLATFIIDCQEIEEALARAANRLNGRVHVLTNFGTSIYRDELDEDPHATLDRLTRLAEQGVYLREHTQCHAKFLVVDDKEVLVTSANCNDNSLKRNLEVGFRTADADTVRSISDLFQHLWIHETRNHLRPQKGQVRVESIPWRHPLKAPPFPEGSATWTRDTDHHLVEVLKGLVASAQDRILVSTYTIKELTRPGSQSEVLLSAIEEALQRGVKVDLLYHATALALGRPAREWEAESFARLHRAAGDLAMRGYDHLHAKYICVDGRRLCLFSANLDGEKGMESGVEVGILIDEPAIIEAVERWHEKSGAAFPYRNVWQPTLTRLASGDATELVSMKQIRLRAAQREREALIQQIRELDGGTVPLESRLPDRAERLFDSNKQGLQPDDLRSHGFSLCPLSLGLKPDDNEIFLTEPLDHEPAVQGYLAPGNIDVVVTWFLSEEKINEHLQDHFLPLLISPQDRVPLVKIVEWASGKFDVGTDLPFANTTNGWSSFIESHLRKGVWKNVILHHQELVVVATEDEIRTLLETIKPQRTEIKRGKKKKQIIVPVERIEKEIIDGALQPLRKSGRLPGWAKWNRLGEYLAGGNWQIVKSGYQRELMDKT